MRKISFLFSIIILLLLAATVSAATSSGTTSTSTSTSDSTSSTLSDSATYIQVTSYSMDPEVFYPYEEGTLTVSLMNTGSSSIGLSHPDILSDKVHVVNENTWNTMTWIGSGSNLTYQFRIKVDPPDGTTYTMFSIATADGGTVHFPLMIKVDSTDIKAVVSETPDAFSPSVRETVNVTVINPRAGEIKNIQITPVGNGITVVPAIKYISSLDGQSCVDVSFGVTAVQESNLTFSVNYDNGDTEHTSNVVLPVKFGTDKSAAVPTVNNVALTSSGSTYDITGDITNTGISDANGLVVTVGSPARGTGTYPEYAVGSLASGDSSSFEVTFTSSDLSSVPLIISWKDAEGYDYSVTKTLDLQSTASSAGSSTNKSTPRSSSGMMQGGPGGMGGPGGSSTSLFGSSNGNGIGAFYPVIAGGIILIVGIVLWKKRKWLSAKLKKQ